MKFYANIDVFSVCLQKAEAELDITAKLIMCFMTELSPEEATKTLEQVSTFAAANCKVTFSPCTEYLASYQNFSLLTMQHLGYSVSISRTKLRLIESLTLVRAFMLFVVIHSSLSPHSGEWRIPHRNKEEYSSCE